MKKIYNQPTSFVVELRGRDAILQSISGGSSLDGTSYGGNSSDHGSDLSDGGDVKGITDVNVWDNEW